MSVQELIKRLQKLDPLLEVHVDVDADFEFSLPVVHDLEVRTVAYSQDPDGPTECEDDAVVLELI